MEIDDILDSFGNLKRSTTFTVVAATGFEPVFTARHALAVRNHVFRVR